MKIWTIIICYVFILSQHAKAQDKDSRIHWLKFEQLADSLRQKPKKTILFFHTDWCTYCRKMMKETFRNRVIANKVNEEYYAVHFDAESTDSIYFDGQVYTNTSDEKSTGHYHSLAKAFLGTKKPIFPTTIILDEDINVILFEQRYLSIREFLKFL